MAKRKNSKLLNRARAATLRATRPEEYAQQLEKEYERHMAVAQRQAEHTGSGNRQVSSPNDSKTIWRQMTVYLDRLHREDSSRSRKWNNRG